MLNSFFKKKVLKDLLVAFQIIFPLAMVGYVLYGWSNFEDNEDRAYYAEVREKIDSLDAIGKDIRLFLNNDDKESYFSHYPNRYGWYSGTYYDFDFNEKKLAQLNNLIDYLTTKKWIELTVKDEYITTNYTGVSIGLTAQSKVLCKDNTAIIVYLYDVESELDPVNGDPPNTLIDVIYHRWFPCYGADVTDLSKKN